MKITNRTLAMWLAACVISLGNVARSQEPTYSRDLYRENEFSIDLFGSLSLGRDTIDDISGEKIDQDGRLGAGAGVNYFFTRYIGVGMDAYTESTKHYFVDSASANLIGRFPIGDSGFAPYIFGGATRQFDDVRQWGGDFGGGFEFRVDEHWGFFVDARYVTANETDNYGVGRAGLRFAF